MAGRIAEPVYLDFNATAPVRPEAAAAVAAALATVGNASSVHGFGRGARAVIEDAREAVAALIGARPAQVVFTSGGTEANALALAGPGRRVVASAVEHDSVLVHAAADRIAVDAEGRVTVDALDALFDTGGEETVVSVMLANNETGVLQPVTAVVEAARRHGALVHTDAIQAAGKVPVDFPALGVDLMSLSAHKLGGPQGVGALVVADGVEPAALFGGGGQERGRRAGTENLPGIAGFGAAARAALAELDVMARLATLRDRIEAAVARDCPETRLWCRDADRLPNTLCLGLPGLAAETAVMALDLEGVAVSAGAACSSGKVRPSHVLEAMGAGEAAARGAVRVSLGWTSTDADADRFLAAWQKLYHRREAA